MDHCSICLEKIQSNPNITICNHKFHRNCLNHWLNHNNTCPMCRTTLFQYTPKIDIMDRLLDLNLNELQNLSNSQIIDILS